MKIEALKGGPKNGYEIARNLAQGELDEAQKFFELIEEQVNTGTYTGDMKNFIEARDRLNRAYQRKVVTSAPLELGTSGEL